MEVEKFQLLLRTTGEDLSPPITRRGSHRFHVCYTRQGFYRSRKQVNLDRLCRPIITLLSCSLLAGMCTKHRQHPDKPKKLSVTEVLATEVVAP
jgi:hypothetical protein